MSHKGTGAHVEGGTQTDSEDEEVVERGSRQAKAQEVRKGGLTRGDSCQQVPGHAGGATGSRSGEVQGQVIGDGPRQILRTTCRQPGTQAGAWKDCTIEDSVEMASSMVGGGVCTLFERHVRTFTGRVDGFELAQEDAGGSCSQI
ncbi:hypothetical protein MRX96_053559 [Rhipicephalus microplus]